MASILRLYKFTETYGFFGDQGQDLLAIHHWFTTGQIPVVGILTSLSTFHMGPMYYYSIAPFVFLFQGNPIGPVVLFLLGGIGLVALGFYLCLKFADLTTAMVFSILLTFSPHLIFLSKGAYSPNLQPLMSVALLYFFLNFLKSSKYKNIFFLFLIIGVGVQYHYLFLANLVIFNILFLIFKRKVFLNLRYYLLAGLGFLSPLVPFLIGQYDLNFQDINGIYLYLTQPEENIKSVITYKDITDKITYPFLIYFSSDKLNWYFEQLTTPLFIALTAAAALISIKYHLIFVRAVMIYFVIGVILSIVAKVKFFWWYEGFFSVIAILVVSCSISFLIKTRYFRAIGLGVWVVFILWELSLLPNAYQIGRLPRLIYKADQLIKDDLKGDIKKPVGLSLNTSISQRQGFDYRYILERDGLETYSATSLADTDYIIVEKDKMGEEVEIPDQLKTMITSLGEVYEHGGISVKSAEVFKVRY
jgi:hypothetical protein